MTEESETDEARFSIVGDSVGETLLSWVTTLVMVVLVARSLHAESDLIWIAMLAAAAAVPFAAIALRDYTRAYFDGGSDE